MRKLFIIICIAIMTPNLFGQSDVQTQSGVRPQKTLKEIRRDNFEKRRLELGRVSSQRRQLPSSSSNKKLSKEEKKRVKTATQIHKDDKAKYKSFLKKSNTGILRLLPDFGCETKNVLRVDGDCKGFIPGRWSYSFRLKNYVNKNFHDISYKKNKLVTNGMLTQGILVSLGDKSLDELSLKSEGMGFLVNFKPETERKLAKSQHNEISNGVVQNDFTYSNQIEVKENNTYALRVIAYKFQDKWSSRLWRRNIAKTDKEERKFDLLQYDKRNDSIFIFRIVRKSEDKGITILWKRLQKQKSPKIVYEENERLRDFKAKK